MRLLFDDGPGELTWRILDVLSEYDQTAVFFLVGERIAGNEALLERMLADGHEIGNHTMSHRRLAPCQSSIVITAQIDWCNAAIGEATGVAPSSFRPPFVAYDDQVLGIARALGLDRHYLESSIGDYALTPDEIVERAAGREFVGLHELPQTVEALPRLLESA